MRNPFSAFASPARRRLGGGGLVAVVGLGLSACAALTDVEAPAAFSDRGAITAYSSFSDGSAAPALAAFAAQYPDIQVSLVKVAPQSLAARLRGEAERPVADVLWGIGRSDLVDIQGLAVLSSEPIAGSERIAAPRYRDTKTPPTFYGLGLSTLVLCVNRTRLAALGLSVSDLSSWDSLLNPGLAGAIVVPNPETSEAGLLLVGSMVQQRGEAGVAYLQALDAQVLRYPSSEQAACDRVKSDAYPNVAVGVSTSTHALAASSSIEPVFLRESGYQVPSLALTRKGQTSPPARTFAAWALSDSAMASYRRDFAATSVAVLEAGNPKVPSAIESYLAPIDLDRLGSSRAQLVATFRSVVTTLSKLE